MNDLISVVMPIYNVELYLETSINSVLNQTYKELEIILVDDGSTDSSSVLCEKYKKKDSRIKVIHKVNGGLSSARNAGLDVATGKYIIFIDSDDAIAHCMIEMLYNVIKKENVDIVACSYECFNDESTLKLDRVECVDKVKIELGRMVTQKLFQGKYKNISFVAWNKLYKKALFMDNSILYPVGKLYEDTFTTYKLLYYAKKVALLDNKLYMYRRREGSIMHSKISKEKFADGILADYDAVAFFSEKKDKEMETYAFVNFFNSQIGSFELYKKNSENMYMIDTLRFLNEQWNDYKKSKDLPLKNKVKFSCFLLKYREFLRS